MTEKSSKTNEIFAHTSPVLKCFSFTACSLKLISNWSYICVVIKPVYQQWCSTWRIQYTNRGRSNGKKKLIFPRRQMGLNFKVSITLERMLIFHGGRVKCISSFKTQKPMSWKDVTECLVRFVIWVEVINQSNNWPSR